ncbi:MutL dimerization domain protein [Ancylostoma ceylanicum]|uniref:MutL dimerization domain protein n=1 Tax=Ancylostoma ceylanicum TaxID=53326 RepID=A0A0D6L4A6_9BILA|nr:MutL dimerization domain protein [Ancylostoma ceylanicum]
MSGGDGARKEVYRIESDVSARISTAQVIVSLSGAVRQLIDNSLDASAQSIEIRVKNNGFESVEVIDDGTGIDADSFTSLCESLTVITRDRSASVGSKLRFDHSGNIVDQSSVARSIGTTVLVENLFETLPVRRKEYEKTAKKEFGRLLTAVQSFALSRPDVKFICSNTVAGRTFNSQLTRNLSRGFELDIGKDTAIIEKMERTMDQEDPCTSTAELAESNSHEHLEDITPSQCVQRSTTFFRTQQTMPFSMKALKDRLNRINVKTKEEQASQAMEFTVSIAPGENSLAEEELDRILKKTDFAQMSVIGQFNKGFIITRLRDHLFLVDQHASDEKYNFERFQKKARVETQKLLHPKYLDLGAVQESVLKDNLDVLEANGFGFEFQDKDIEEILAVVSEFPGVMYRPAKLRRIFASRACRKSVMIGTALTTNQMQTNCPHGRPTLRHLVDLRKAASQSRVQL